MTVWYDCGGGTAAGLDEGQPPFDTEARHCCEPIGFHVFAWLPKKCRNGKVRWFKWLEDHRDGTYTLGRCG